MSNWGLRPPDVAGLLNPGFVAVLLRDLVISYYKVDAKPVPFILPFISLPLIFHRSTRAHLPNSTARNLNFWWQENPALRVDFVQRVRSFVGPTREAIYLGAQSRMFAIEGGHLIRGHRQLGKDQWQPTAEMNEIQKAVQFFGRWFGRHSIDEILTVFGIRP